MILRGATAPCAAISGAAGLPLGFFQRLEAGIGILPKIDGLR